MITVNNLSKVYRQPKKDPGLAGAIKHIVFPKYIEKIAVDNISMKIDEGEAVAYVGPNGAGKSTTIKMLTGIIQPTHGKVKVCGLEPAKNRMQNAKNIGVVFGQRSQLWLDVPIQESFMLSKEIYQIPDKDFRRQYDYLIDILELAEILYLSARKLSLGQRMRADLAMALLHNPRILFLDEPTIGLDIVVKRKMRDFIKTLNKELSTTILLTTHDLEDIEDICRRIIIINNGAIIYDGDIQCVKDKYAHKRTISIEMMHPLKEINASGFEADSDVTIVNTDEKNVNISFDKNKHSAVEILSIFSERHDIKDFQIKEPSIEEVITLMYSGKIGDSHNSEITAEE